MWSDIETSVDLLGYSVHASLLRDVVTNSKNLPITIGLYGDWGCGKSSVLKILEEELKADKDCVVIYFDGWSFESFDDAKMALIQGIVDSLERNERFWEKTKDKAGELKEAFKKLGKSISWMRVLKWTATGASVLAAGATGGASLIIPTLIELFNSNKGKLEELLTSDNTEQFLKDYLFKDGEEKRYEAVRDFRKDFEDLINKSKQGKIIVLIDDLDRCLPRHIIDNLEAIKLFLNVPKTAFVIAADQFIVSNAVRSEYKTIIEASQKADTDNTRPNLGDSYMEKFIQLPYNIPALSHKEVESYVTLLFCESLLEHSQFKTVQADFANFCRNNKFDRYGWSNIQEILTGEFENKQELQDTIGFVIRFSSILGQSLRWNPRLIKRFLNAYEIRANLLAQSGITDQKSKFALLKLMLIEQKDLNLFKQLNNWVMSEPSTPKELISIENFAQSDRSGDFEFNEWNQTDLLQIISEDPLFSKVDMKELFWVSRDKIINEMSGISLIPSRIRMIFKDAYDSTDKICNQIIQDKVLKMDKDDLSDFFNLLDAQITIDPKAKNGYSIYCACDNLNVTGAYERLSNILSRIDVRQIPMSLGNKFHDLLNRHDNDGSLRNKLSGNQKLIKAIDSVINGNFA